MAEEIDRDAKKRRQEEAKKKLLQQFTDQQKEFAKTIEGTYVDDDDDDDDTQHLGTSLLSHLLSSILSSLRSSLPLLPLLLLPSLPILMMTAEAVCILCRETSPLYSESKPLGAIMSIQRSKIASTLCSPLPLFCSPSSLTLSLSLSISLFFDERKDTPIARGSEGGEVLWPRDAHGLLLRVLVLPPCQAGSRSRVSSLPPPTPSPLLLSRPLPSLALLSFN